MQTLTSTPTTAPVAITKVISTKPITPVSEYSYYSVSRLQTYLKCGEAYRLQYVERLPREYTSSYSTVVGSLVHHTLEVYFLAGSVGSLLKVFEEHSEDCLRNLGLIGNTEEYVYSDLLRYARGVHKLYEKASATYTGKDAIRTAKGEVPQVPQATSAWKEAMAGLGQGLLKDGLDAHSMGKGLSFSLCDAYAEAYALVKLYKVPPMDILHVELGLSKRDGESIINPVPLPIEYGGDKGIYLSGSIDAVCYYKGKLSIVDHKTSSGPAPTEEDVSTNPQLLAYAWAYEQLTGKVIEGVGINHIRSGKLVWAPVTPHKDKVLRSLLGAHKAIETGYFPLHTPSEYDSPCSKWYGKECPFKARCWGV